MLTGKPIGERSLGRLMRRWEDNIRMDLNNCVSIRGSGLIRLRIEIFGEPLWMRLWTSVFHIWNNLTPKPQSQEPINWIHITYFILIMDISCVLHSVFLCRKFGWNRSRSSKVMVKKAYVHICTWCFESNW